MVNLAAKSEPLELATVIPAELAGKRLDQALASLFSDYSRARISDWIKAGQVLVDQHPARPRDKVHGGEHIHISAQVSVSAAASPEAIALDVIYEDADVIVLNKPVGLVVHPGAGNPQHTLLNALLNHDPALDQLPRAGIIQRLDKDTSGIMVVTRSLRAHTRLVVDLQARRLKREYLAIVNGVLTAGGTVDAPIGRHPRQRTRMAITTAGKPAITHFRVEQRYRAHTLIRAQLESGRTHQIRVHMAHIQHAVLGDPAYNNRPTLPRGADQTVIDGIRRFRRQALHAQRLGFSHPGSGDWLEFDAPPPADFAGLCELLAGDAART
ncbi:MAG: 23S rRNA pseudouridine(1911/1915/1917) synthase RluD [Gammaproteobacteria bacterium]